MSKLREKFEAIILDYFDKADKCEQIADDFAVKFQIWLLLNDDLVVSINYETPEEAITELLQIFKEKYYE